MHGLTFIWARCIFLRAGLRRELPNANRHWRWTAIWLTLMAGLVSASIFSVEALAWFRRSIEANRNFPRAHFHLAAALARLGSLNEARAAAQAGLALDPGFTVRRFRVGTSGNNPKYLAGRERMLEGLLIAGVPEG